MRWLNPSINESYPEKFFTQVIENEFDDKNFVREYPFEKYSFDFAWLHKKKVIEIDGDQHIRYQRQIISDKTKDSLASDEGWVVLRILWREFYREPKKWIKISNDFIGM